MELSKFHLSLFNEWHGCGIGDGFSFRALAQRTQREVTEIAQAVRDLAAFGFLEFATGLCADDGEFRGSGYILTKFGHNMLNGGDE